MASCGPTTAATQLNKLVNTDNSLHHERAAGQAQGASLRGDPRQLSQRDRQMFERMQGSQRPDALRFEQFRQEVPVYGPPAQQQQPQNNNWVTEFGRNSPVPQQQPVQQPLQRSSPVTSTNWAAEFQQPAAQTRVGGMSNMASTGRMGMSGGYMGGMGMMGGMSQMGSVAKMPTHAETAHADSQAADAKWEAEFNKLEAANQQTTESTTTETAQESDIVVDEDDAGQAMLEKLMKEAAETEVEHSYDDYGPLDGAYPPNWDEMWDKISHADDGSANVRTEDFARLPGTYDFAEERPYADEEDPFAMGVYMMDYGAKLSCAALCFEEAVRRDPSHVEAWARLGMAQAQNEVEDQAIIALERAIALNPRHERALLNLAISYTNEGYDAAASQLLEKWASSRYPDIAELVPPATDHSAQALHARVTEMFLRAARSSGAQLDPDVQAGLGVLCYRDDDYDKAIDCFRAALSATPNDASIWNRLGATLANASQPEEAIEAYERALSLRPSFVRARYNLAVSCVNLGCYREAAEHLLSAMALHETQEGATIDLEGSANLVDTLRRVFFAMDRRDLLQYLQPGTKLDVFREEFNF